ncbi:glycolate oxidase subunit GlcF [Rhodomicrobium lacus]|uniref:glycolate oxidase subunit GlcF n=1 Tax=Rhodomicrobium lacus TaxID=2498452 RepID=UPI0026E41099|nr:glycolate oxidase subunit GlcF [Rhodomicrobium lacus]WKW49961.1 glycolate oxidase subunit GlcF [Rhodomicrobium lacus]
METNFTLAQLRDPRMKEADAILRKCVHCGFCIATCPTYLMLGDERDSPRGRIYLIKTMLEGKATPKQVRPHLDRCLSCFSCMTTCPSGVDYRHLSDYARQIIETSSRRSPADEAIRKLLRAILPYPKRFRVALGGVFLALPLRRLLINSRFKTIGAMLNLAPRGRVKSGVYTQAGTVKTEKPRRGRVLLLRGCVQRVLKPNINDSTVRFLNHIGYDVVLSENEGCCGSLTLHMGKEAEAKAMAKANIDIWHDARESGPIDAIVINASGCGSTVKDYAHLFADDPAYAEKARYVSSLAKDVSEFAASRKIDAPVGWSDIRVAYQSSCSMQHGQRVIEEPRQLLRNAGFTVVEIPEGHICCGSAGTYNMLQPDLAKQLRERKLQAIASVKPDVVASGNVGCISQLSGPFPIVHTVELLDWAYGGPCPAPLKHLEGRIRPLPREGESAETEGALA